MDFKSLEFISKDRYKFIHETLIINHDDEFAKIKSKCELKKLAQKHCIIISNGKDYYFIKKYQSRYSNGPCFIVINSEKKEVFCSITEVFKKCKIDKSYNQYYFQKNEIGYLGWSSPIKYDNKITKFELSNMCYSRILDQCKKQLKQCKKMLQIVVTESYPNSVYLKKGFRETNDWLEAIREIKNAELNLKDKNFKNVRLAFFSEYFRKHVGGNYGWGCIPDNDEVIRNKLMTIQGRAYLYKQLKSYVLSSFECAKNEFERLNSLKEKHEYDNIN